MIGGAPVRRRVAELAARFALPDGAEASLLVLLDLVAEDPLAPTTVRDRMRAADSHLADSLVALELEPVRAARTIADLGAGAGFPGLPLAIALPEANVLLVESDARKCSFLDRAIAACGIANASVVASRAEEWRAGLGTCDLVAARALASLPVVAEYAAPLLRVGGTLVAWRGRRDPQAEAEAATATVELGLSATDPLLVAPYPGAQHRHLHLMLKVRDTPERFPRRAGVARKRPLGRSSDRARR